MSAPGGPLGASSLRATTSKRRVKLDPLVDVARAEKPYPLQCGYQPRQCMIEGTVCEANIDQIGSVKPKDREYEIGVNVIKL